MIMGLVRAGITFRLYNSGTFRLFGYLDNIRLQADYLSDIDKKDHG